jgi:hypothetical protein
MFDKEFLDAVMKSAGIGAAVGWAIQYLMWHGEREERKSAHAFILTMLDKVTTERVQGTNAISTLTTAVNAIIEIVKGDKR